MAQQDGMGRAESRSGKFAKRSGLLKHQLRLVKRPDCDRYEIAPIEDTLSFEKGFFLFIRAVQLLTQETDGVVVVGLAGPSGAGKTVFTEKVSAFMPGIAMISMDNYNDASRVIDGNYDDPRLTDYDTLLDNLENLKEGRSVEVPIYDFKQSRRVGYSHLDVPSSRIVIVEGIYALSEKLRPLLDLRVSVTGGVHFDLVKRVLRDINRSGQAPEDIIHQISETVYPMYKAFIEPDLETAHIKIVNKFNPFSGFQSATYILKSSRCVSEEQIKRVLGPDHTETTEATYDIYLLPPGEDPETCQSYLRMRNREGKYSLMFEEWVTDNAFIISPRITFEVSVRLLGGLMALGYSMATILKRNSHLFSDDRVSVKIDQLEQLQRKYIQVQGKDRAVVAEVAKKLGLDGTYIPRSYIEQIQLEKLTKEITALPEDLKTKLSMPNNLVSSPLPSFSWLSEAKPGIRSLYSKSWSRNESKSDSDAPEDRRMQRKGVKPTPLWTESKQFDDRALPDSPAPAVADQGYLRVCDQLAGLSERMDELLSRVSELEGKITGPSNTGRQAPTGANVSGVAVGSFGSSGGSHYGNGNGNGCTNGHALALNNAAAPPASDSNMVDEVRLLARGQRHITTQLDLLSSILRDNLTHPNLQKKNERGRWECLFGSMKTSNSGLATASVVIGVGLTSLVALAVAQTLKKSC